MDFLNKLNSRNNFGISQQMTESLSSNVNTGNIFSNIFRKENMVNIICGVLLIILIVILIVCLCKPKDKKDK
jgi:hypothetical protein